MKKSKDELAARPLDPTKGVRRKYFDRMQQGTNIVLLEPDLVESFPDSESVNKALRELKKIALRSAEPVEKQEKSAAATR